MYKTLIALCLLVFPLASYADVEKERKEVLDESKEIPQRPDKEKQGTKAKIANAAGYATFSNIGVNVIFI